MKHFHGNPYDGSLRIVGRFKAFAIGAESEYDQVLIDGKLLSAGRVLPVDCENPTVKWARGPRSSTWTAHVIGFECGDQIFNPGPRAPRDYVFAQANLPAHTASMGGRAEFVVPFVGRRAARYIVNTVGTRAVEYVAYFRKHLELDGRVPLMTSTTRDIAAESGFTYAAPHTTSVPFPADADSIDEHGVNLGGTDSFESFDELVLYINTLSGEGGTDGADAHVTITVIGEEGCA